MKHLVLGSSGQIGSRLCSFLKEIGEEVVEFDIKLGSEQYDLRDAKHDGGFVFKVQSSDIVHFLAFDVGGYRYLRDFQSQYSFIENNSMIMQNVFSVINDLNRKTGKNKKFIFYSSQMSLLKDSPYGTLKKLGEYYTKTLKGISVRLWNVYGLEKDQRRFHVISDFIHQAKTQGKIKMLSQGNELRQFLFVDDLCECILIMCQQYDYFAHEINKDFPWDISSFRWTYILAIAKIVKLISSNEIEIEAGVEDVSGTCYEPDESILNYWKPKTTLEEGIRFIWNNYTPEED